MSTSPSRGGALRAFRLADIPIDIRVRAKDSLLRRAAASRDGTVQPAHTPIERLQLGIAAEQPSERVYAASKTAWRSVMGDDR